MRKKGLYFLPIHNAIKDMYAWRLLKATETIIDAAMFDFEDDDMVLNVPFGNMQPILDVVVAKESNADAFFFETVFSGGNAHVALPMPRMYKSTVNQWMDAAPQMHRRPLGIPPRGKKWDSEQGGWKKPCKRKHVRVYVKGCGFLKRRHEKEFVNALWDVLKRMFGNAPPTITESAIEYLDLVFSKTDIDVEGVLRYQGDVSPKLGSNLNLPSTYFRDRP